MQFQFVKWFIFFFFFSCHEFFLWFILLFMSHRARDLKWLVIGIVFCHLFEIVYRYIFLSTVAYLFIYLFIGQIIDYL